MCGRARNWCITINDTDEVYLIESFLIGGPSTTDISRKLRYMVWQFEQCPTTLRHHVQMYCEFTDPHRMSAVKELLSCPKAHLESRKGTRDQARDYCMKEDTRIAGPYELGVWEIQERGKRTDLDEMAERVKAGDTLLEVAEQSPATYIRNYRGIANFKFLFDQQTASKNFREVVTCVITGPSGCGKTHSVFEYCKNNNYSLFKLDVTDGALWFDGYSNEDALLIDDFYGGIKYHMILNMLDRYPYRCNIKGGHVWAAWKLVFITSNKVPSEWYKQGMTGALNRRMTYWVKMQGREEPLENGFAGLANSFDDPRAQAEPFPLISLGADPLVDEPDYEFPEIVHMDPYFNDEDF